MVVLVLRHGALQYPLAHGRSRVGSDPLCEVCLREPSVASVHAVVEATSASARVEGVGSSLVVVGGVPVVRPRLVRAGDRLTIGDVEMDVEVDAKTSNSSRDLAAAIVRSSGVAKAHAAIEVVEGPSSGALFVLEEEGREYHVGNGPDPSDLSIRDTSRADIAVVRRGSDVLVRDAGSRSAYIGGARLDKARAILWERGTMVRVGDTVLAVRPPLLEVVSDVARRVIRSDPPPRERASGVPPMNNRRDPVLWVVFGIALLTGAVIVYLVR